MWESEQEIENHKTGVNKSVCSVKYTFIPESYLQKISQFITQKDIVVKKTKQKINKNTKLKYYFVPEKLNKAMRVTENVMNEITKTSTAERI